MPDVQPHLSKHQMHLLTKCGVEGCHRPLMDAGAQRREPSVLHRCALHEIASYNDEELREWGDENAADMVGYARLQLAQEDAVTEQDIEAIGKAIHGYACGCERPWPMNANYEEMARVVADAVFGGEK